MTYTAVGSLTGTGANPGTLNSFSITPGGVGNFILIEVVSYLFGSTGRTPTALSSSNVTWSALGTLATGTAASGFNGSKHQCFLGVVTSTSTATVTITWSGSGSPTFEGVAYQEFSSTTGIPVLDKQTLLDNGGTGAWPSLTPAVSGEIYFGYVLNTAAATSGSTSGYTYNANVDTGSNGAAYNLNVTAASNPSWGDSGQSSGIVLLVMPSTTPAPDVPPVQWRAPGRIAPSSFAIQWPPPVNLPVTSVTNQITLTGLATSSGVQQLQIGANEKTTATASSTIRRALSIAQNALASAVATANRQIRSNVAGSATASANVANQVRSRMASSATASGTLTTLKSKLLSLATQSTASAALGRTLSLFEQSQAVGSGSVVRSVRTALSAAPAAIGSLRNQIGKRLILSGGSAGSWSMRQEVVNNNGATTSNNSPAISITATQSGSLLLAWLTRSGGSGTGAISSVTDSAGNTWTHAASGAVSGGNFTRIELWYSFQDVASGVTSLTANSAAAQRWGWDIQEWTGPSGGLTLDAASATYSSDTTTPFDTPSITTTGSADLVVAGMHEIGTNAITFNSASPWAADGTALGFSGSSVAQVAHNAGTSGAGNPSGSYSAEWTGTSGNAGTVTAAFTGSLPAGAGVMVSATLGTFKSRLMSLVTSVTASPVLMRILGLGERTQVSAGASVIRRITRNLSASVSALPGMATLKATLVTLATSASAIGKLANQVRTKFASQAIASSAIARQIRPKLTTIVTSSPILSRFMAIFEKVNVTAAPNMATLKATLISLTTSATAIGKVANRVGTRLAAQATASGSQAVRVGLRAVTPVTVLPSVRRALSMAQKGVATASATMVTTRVTLMQLLAQATATAQAARRVGTRLAGQATSSGVLFRRLPVDLNAIATASGSVIRRITKLTPGQASAIATANVLKLRLFVLNALATAQANVKRGLSLGISGSATAQPNMFRSITQKVTTAASALSNVIPIRILTSLRTLTKGLRGFMHHDTYGGRVHQDSYGGDVSAARYGGNVRHDRYGGNITRDTTGGRDHA